MPLVTYLLVALVAYLLGSIPFGFLLVWLFRKEDIRSQGSGNIGATNVVRSGAKGLGALTFLLDACKGYVAALLAVQIGLLPGLAPAPRGNIAAVAAMCAVLGHMYTVWLGFKGGKGVATSLGAFLVICPQAVGAGIALWLLVAGFWGYSSLGSILMAAAMPLFVYLLYEPRHAPPSIVTGGVVAISLLVLAKHRANLERLVAGTEDRLRPPRR